MQSHKGCCSTEAVVSKGAQKSSQNEFFTVIHYLLSMIISYPPHGINLIHFVIVQIPLKPL